MNPRDIIVVIEIMAVVFAVFYLGMLAGSVKATLKTDRVHAKAIKRVAQEFKDPTIAKRYLVAVQYEMDLEKING